MSVVYDCRDESSRADGLAAARQAIREGQLVVMPTDTVYGVAADAFSPSAVASLLAAKGRGRDMPVPVLVGSPATLAGIAVIDARADALVHAFWPGGLTLICQQQPTLQWDLGDAQGTVAVRMPDHEIAIAVLTATGPLAVSSANLSGQRPSQTAEQARSQLGDRVAVYLEAGTTGGDVPSTIVDVTGAQPRMVRTGTIDLEQLRAVVPGVLGPDEADES